MATRSHDEKISAELGRSRQEHVAHALPAGRESPHINLSTVAGKMSSDVRPGLLTMTRRAVTAHDHHDLDRLGPHDERHGARDRARGLRARVPADQDSPDVRWGRAWRQDHDGTGGAEDERLREAAGWTLPEAGS